MIKLLSEQEMQKASLILQFLNIAKEGLVKPYDPLPVVNKLVSSRKEGLDDLMNCCPPSAVVRDAKDLKPYIMAALDDLSDLMGFKLRLYR